MQAGMGITKMWRRPAQSLPLGVISLGVIASYSGIVLLVWLSLRLL
jgi:hypothetical protein